jgi:hypothetical protein
MKVDMFNSFHTKVWYEIRDSIELNLSKEIHKHIGFIPRLQMRIGISMPLRERMNRLLIRRPK